MPVVAVTDYTFPSLEIVETILRAAAPEISAEHIKTYECNTREHHAGDVVIFQKGAYFLFAAVKVRNCHGGPGRAIVLY